MDPVRNQIGRARTAMARASNPFTSALGIMFGRNQAVWDARLGLEVHQARNNLNREHQKNLTDDMFTNAQRFKDMGVESYAHTPLGGQDVRFGKPKGSKGEKTEASNPTVDALKDMDMSEGGDTTSASKPRKKRAPSSTPNFKDLDTAVARGGVSPFEAAQLNPKWSTSRGGTGKDFTPQPAPIWSEGRTQSSNVGPGQYNISDDSSTPSVSEKPKRNRKKSGAVTE